MAHVSHIKQYVYEIKNENNLWIKIQKYRKRRDEVTKLNKNGFSQL